MYIADLHIHSKYSRATSRDCDLEHLDMWSRKKGIHLIGTGDFTHPEWRRELSEKLICEQDGFYTLKKEFSLGEDVTNTISSPRFVITGEISSIYKKNGKVRKVHNLIILPDLNSAELLSKKLEAIGNIHSDGRPILGLDSRDLLEITLEVSPQAIFIPAHIWTPHFSMFGAFSGFDSIEECFEDMTPQIRAVETGLSSDPIMNRRISALDNYNLVSNSDAHSPSKLGREANLFSSPLDFDSFAASITGVKRDGLYGTIEFFPEEGKYHLDGHRKCGKCYEPKQTLELSGICPVCGRKLTVGVLNRVEQLADRNDAYRTAAMKPFESLIPLPEVIASSVGISPTGKNTNIIYEDMLKNVGSEFYILRDAPLSELRDICGENIAEGIKRMREGKVKLIPGFDGEYGKVSLFETWELNSPIGQLSMIDREVKMSSANSSDLTLKTDTLKIEKNEAVSTGESNGLTTVLTELNKEQLEAVTSKKQVIEVIAGPGTGKTKTLISRIIYLIEVMGVMPSEITAVTFTNKAAAQMRLRLKSYFDAKTVKNITIGTFHSICYQLITKEKGHLMLVDENDAISLALELKARYHLTLSAKKLLNEFSSIKNNSNYEADEAVYLAYLDYCNANQKNGVIDFDDILLDAMRLCSLSLNNSKFYKKFTYLLIDEFQDINDLQYRLIQLWSKNSKNLFVIGDPDQSIYGFRGSNPNCFDILRADFENIHRISLYKNYRSTPQIVKSAVPVISVNKGRTRKLESQLENGENIYLFGADSAISEAIYISKSINGMVGGIDMLDSDFSSMKIRDNTPHSFSDIAVLYRTHRQAEIIEKCLQKEGIPYTVSGKEEELFSDNIIRATLSFFKFIINRKDIRSFKTYIKVFYAFADSFLESFPEEQNEKNSIDIVCNFLADKRDNDADRILSVIKKFTEKIKESPDKLLEDWAAENNIRRNDKFEKLVNMSVLFKDIDSFLNNIAIGEESDIIRSGNKMYSSESVSMMTLHGAKGLEFDVVFICGVNQDIIPLNAVSGTVDIEEERRLFYVGLTRAKQQLIITSYSEPSQFLADIPKKLVFEDNIKKKKLKAEIEQISLF